MRYRVPFGTQPRSGFAIFPIVLALTLLGMLAWATSYSVRSSSATTSAVRIAADLQGQANLIRQRIVQCYLEYTAGGYPVTPGSALVSDLLCPGASPTAQPLWTGTEGTFLPTPPPGFGAWTYRNDANGIEITAAALPGSTLDATVTTAIADASRRFSNLEADCLATASPPSMRIWLLKNPSAPAPTSC